MHAAFIFHAGKGAVSTQGEHGFLYAAQFRFVERHHFHAIPVPLGIAGIHAQKIRAKQAGLLTARPCTNFHDHVALIIGILRQKQQPKLLLHVRTAAGQLVQLRLRHGCKLRIVQHFFGFSLLGQQLLITLPRLYGWLQLGVLLEQPLPSCRIGNDLRLAHRLAQLVIPLLHPLEFLCHAQRASTMRRIC